MRMQFREKLDFIYKVPKGNRPKVDQEGRRSQGDTISTYGRLAAPVSSSMRFQRNDVQDQSSALYYVYYTAELEDVLRQPQSWDVRPSQHYKLKGTRHSIISVDLDYRAKMLEIRI